MWTFVMTDGCVLQIKTSILRSCSVNNSAIYLLALCALCFDLSARPLRPPTVWNHRLGLLREPDWEEPAGCPEVSAHAWGGPASGPRPLLHGGWRALHSCGRGCGAGERRAVSHHIPGYRYILTARFLFLHYWFVCAGKCTDDAFFIVRGVELWVW